MPTPKPNWTPGPWEVDSGMVQTVAEHECRTPGCGVHIPIAWMDREPDNGTLPVERDANAHLIAAAPELVEALRALVDCPDYRGINTLEMRRATSILAKLEGK